MSSLHPVVARIMLPDDANVAGNVHGGTILKGMEQAGTIAAMRYLAAQESDAHVAALVRFDDMSFFRPMFVGDVASYTAEVIFTSQHSICVKVVVSAEDLRTCTPRITNSGYLWYVPLIPGPGKDWTKPQVTQVPPMPAPTDSAVLTEYHKAEKSYDQRKETGSSQKSTEPSVSDLEAFKQSYQAPDSSSSSPSASQQELCQVVLPGDCGTEKVAFGGFVMKLMDNAAGCAAFRHCRTNVVTVAISSLNFVEWIRLGDACTIRSKVVFGSSKTLEIEVSAYATSVMGHKPDSLVATGLFVFASLDEKGKAIPVPPLRLETDEDFRKFFLGQQRYEAAKRARAALETTTST